MILLTLYIFIYTMAHTDCSDSDSPYSNVPPPRFVSTPTNITVRPGDSVVLPCSIQHLGTKRVAWRQVEKEKFLTIGTTTWIKDNNYVVQHKEDEVTDITVWNLKIKNVKTEMAGEYECQTTAIAGHSKIVYLQVVGTPLSKPGKIDFGHLHKYKYSSSNLRLTGNKFVEQGHQIHLTCNATGGDRIPEEIDWFKDGDLIEPHKYSDIIITKYRSLEVKALVSELIVDHSDRSHAGTYICRSSQDKIDKLTVEVLVADTTNVKRGTGKIINGKTVSSTASDVRCLDIYLTIFLTVISLLRFTMS